MRLKHVKGAHEKIEKSEMVIKNPESYKGSFCDLFMNHHPIHIEIGMGKGNFIIGMALKYPDVNFIGIEKYDSVVAKCLPKIDSSLTNLAIIRMDALNIEQVFDHEISRIYLNFSDPWPKKRHHLRRLSSKIFLNKYSSIFKDDYDIWMRTDNQDLFCYSLMSFSEEGYVLRNLTFDLHSNLPEDFITTEYEDRFSDRGMPIYSVEAVKVSNKVNK